MLFDKTVLLCFLFLKMFMNSPNKNRNTYIVQQTFARLSVKFLDHLFQFHQRIESDKYGNLDEHEYMAMQSVMNRKKVRLMTMSELLRENSLVPSR